MKNKLTDLTDHLFAQLERLSEEEMTAEQIAAEVQRANAVVQVADTIVANARLQLDGAKLVVEWGDKAAKHLPMIAGPVAESSR